MAKKRLTPQQTINKYFRRTEEQEQRELCIWIKAKYPNVLYTVDLAGMSLTKAQRTVHSTRCKRGCPDLMFQEWLFDHYCGLAIEFKRTGESVTLKDGSLITAGKKGQHLKEQLEYIKGLRSKRWVAGFVIGIEDAKKVISAYLSPNDNPTDSPLRIIDKYIYPKLF